MQQRLDKLDIAMIWGAWLTTTSLISTTAYYVAAHLANDKSFASTWAICISILFLTTTNIVTQIAIRVINNE